MRVETWVLPLLICLCAPGGCARAEEEHGAAPSAPVEAGGPADEGDEPSVWTDDLPEEVEVQIEGVVERATVDYSLSAAETEGFCNQLLTLPADSGSLALEIHTVLERTPEGSWRALPSIAALLQRPDAKVRETALVALGHLSKPFLDPPDLEEFYLEAYVPLLMRSTYDSSPTVRERACGMLGGVARGCARRLPFPAPVCVHDRLEALTRDPSPSIALGAAWALYDGGRKDVLTPEQIESVESITR